MMNKEAIIIAEILKLNGNDVKSLERAQKLEELLAINDPAFYTLVGQKSRLQMLKDMKVHKGFESADKIEYDDVRDLFEIGYYVSVGYSGWYNKDCMTPLQVYLFMMDKTEPSE